MVQTSSQSTVNKIEMRLRGKGRGSIVFQQDYADCGYQTCRNKRH